MWRTGRLGGRLCRVGRRILCRLGLIDLTGQLLHQYVGHESPLLTIGFSEDGQQVYTADRGNVYVWRTTLADVIDFACEQLSRDFTAEERAFYNIEDNDPTCPDRLEQVAQTEENTVPAILECVENYCTLGEISQVFRGIFGEQDGTPSF